MGGTIKGRVRHKYNPEDGCNAIILFYANTPHESVWVVVFSVTLRMPQSAASVKQNSVGRLNLPGMPKKNDINGTNRMMYATNVFFFLHIVQLLSPDLFSVIGINCSIFGRYD